jgi:hypothetical protein
LQCRDDFPKIVAACVRLAHSATNHSISMSPFDPLAPPELRALSPVCIAAFTNFVEVDFEGNRNSYGFTDKYGYSLSQTNLDKTIWGLSFFSKNDFKYIGTFTNE